MFSQLLINPLNTKDVYIRPEIRDSDTEDVYICPPWSFVLFSSVVCDFFPWSFVRVWEVVKSPLTKELECGHYIIPMCTATSDECRQSFSRNFRG